MPPLPLLRYVVGDNSFFLLLPNGHTQVEMDVNMQSSIQSSANTDIQHVVNCAIATAIPAVITTVDQRIGTVLGTAVSTMETVAGRVESATKAKQSNFRKSSGRPVTHDDYDGDTEVTVTPRKSAGPKHPKINKQHVRICIHYVACSVTHLF
jgi:hypothetical protein